MTTTLHQREASVSAQLCRAGLLSVAAACVVLLPLITNPFAENFSHTRFHWLATCAALIVALGAFLRAETGRSLLDANAPAPLRWLWVLTLWVCLSATFSIEPLTAWLGDTTRREGALSWLFVAVIATTVWMLGERAASWRTFLWLVSLASVVPACAALAQFFASGAAFRVTGTLGNTGFLGALLMLALPLSIAQALVSASLRERIGWLLLATLQAMALMLSFARGPLIGAVAACGCLLLWSGVAQRRHLLMLIAGALPLLAGVVVLLANLVPSLSEVVPDLARLQLKINPSSESRLGIWGAGMTLFAEAGLLRQAIGFGVDTGWLTHMTHMPTWVYRIEGLGFNVDRMHSQQLETLLNAGVVGVLLEWALFLAVAHLWLKRLGITMTFRALAASALVSAVAFGGIAMAVFGPAPAPSAFAIGLAVGVMGSLLFRQWIDGRRQPYLAPEPEQVLVAALGAALMGYWIESQLGVNDVSVRLMACVMMALICVRLPARSGESGEAQAQEVERSGAKQAEWPTLPGHWLVWLVTPALFMAWAPAQLGSGIWLGAAPRPLIECLLMIAALDAFCWMTTPKPSATGAGKVLWWPWLAFLPLYALLHYLLMASVAGLQLASGASAESILLLIWLVLAAIFSALLALALGCFARVPQSALAVFISRPRLSGAIALSGLVCVVAASYLVVRDVRSDTLARLAGWSAQQGKWSAALDFAEAAARESPVTRGRWTALARTQFGAAFRSAQDAASPALAREAEVKSYIGQSEAALTKAVALARQDPFVLALMGELNSFKATPLAMAFFGGDTARAAHSREAKRYFEASLLSRGNHPPTLRSLIRWELEYGTPMQAIRLAESLMVGDPKSPIGYEERALIALRANDNAVFVATLRKGVEMTEGALSLRRPLAEWQFRQGDVAGAVREMEAARLTAPKDWEVTRDLIRLYLRQNANDKALALAQGARSFVPEQERASLEELLRNLEPKPFTGGGLKP